MKKPDHFTDYRQIKIIIILSRVDELIHSAKITGNIGRLVIFATGDKLGRNA